MFYPLPRLLGRHLTLSASRVGREIRYSVAPPVPPTGRVPLRSPVHRSQGCDKTTPDLVTHAGPGFRTRISVLAVFRLGKVRVPQACVRGLQRVPDSKTRGHWISRSVTKVEFSGWAPRDLPNTTSRLQGKIADPDLTPGRHNLRARLCFQPHPMLSQFSIATPQLLDELRINVAADALRFLVPTSSNARLSRLL